VVMLFYQATLDRLASSSRSHRGLASNRRKPFAELDFDMNNLSWERIASPGNEQRRFWGSQGQADIAGFSQSGGHQDRRSSDDKFALVFPPNGTTWWRPPGD